MNTTEVRGALQQEKDWDTSLLNKPTRKGTELEKKQILALCVKQGLLAAFGLHTYTWKGEVRMQRSGLPIGPDLTRAAARIIMLDWDQHFIRLARNNKMEYCMYRRYMDDTANCAEMLTPKLRWSEEEGSMVMHHNLVEEDRNSQMSGQPGR